MKANFLVRLRASNNEVVNLGSGSWTNNGVTFANSKFGASVCQ